MAPVHLGSIRYIPKNIVLITEVNTRSMFKYLLLKTPKLPRFISKLQLGARKIPPGVRLVLTINQLKYNLQRNYICIIYAEMQMFYCNFSSALDKIIVQGYKALNLEYFFTAGADEVKAWIIQVIKFVPP